MSDAQDVWTTGYAIFCIVLFPVVVLFMTEELKSMGRRPSVFYVLFTLVGFFMFALLVPQGVDLFWSLFDNAGGAQRAFNYGVATLLLVRFCFDVRLVLAKLRAWLERQDAERTI